MYPYFEIFGRTFASYGICMALAIILVCGLSIGRARRYAVPMEDILIMSAMAVGVGLLAAKGLYVAISLFLLYREKVSHRTDSQLMIYLMDYALLRFVLEFFRGDRIRGGFAALSTSQWISLILLAVGFLLSVSSEFGHRFCKKRAG